MDERDVKQKTSIDVVVGSQIRRRRRELKLSAKHLGELIGVTPAQISNYEKGNSKMAAVRLYAISVALEVPIAYFFPDLNATIASPRPDPKGIQEDDKSMLRIILQLGQIAAQIEDPKVRSTVRELLRGLPTRRSKGNPEE